MNTDAFSFSFKLDDADEEPKNGVAAPASSPPKPLDASLTAEPVKPSDPFAFDREESHSTEAVAESIAPKNTFSLPDLDLDFGDDSQSLKATPKAEETSPVIDTGSWLQDEPVIAAPKPVEINHASTPAPAPQPEAEPQEAAEIVIPAVSASQNKASVVTPRFGEDGQQRVRPRVAVLGASGMGSNHARWFASQGCEVVSILGSSRDTNENTRLQLKNAFDFEGESFTDLGDLLRESKPAMVCIATPNEMHFAQVLECLEAGAHVLCEKPLVYVPGRSQRENSDSANELVKVAETNGLKLATQLQYAPATAIVCKLAGTTPETVGDCAMEIETVNPNSPRNARGLWIDLGPHPLSVMQYLAGPNAKIVPELTQFQMREEGDLAEVMVRFGVQTEGGRLITGRAIVRRFDGEFHKRAPRRRIALNGRAISYSGFKGSDGLYKAEFTSPDGYANHYPDPVSLLIENFVQACQGRAELLTGGDFGAQNVDWLLSLTR